MPPQALLHAREIHKTYLMGEEELHVLRGVDLSVEAGEWVAVLGTSGSGKSTLLHILGALDQPTRGSVTYQGQDVYAKEPWEQDLYRKTVVGFVFQQYHLLPELTLLENVVIGAMIAVPPWTWLKRKAAATARATAVIESLGLKDRIKHRPNKLSGGERQRAAIARALINEPAVLLADEPTGNLDIETGKQILEVFRQLHKAGQAIVMVTHDERVAAMADRRVKLESGRLK